MSITPNAIYLKDYASPHFSIPEIHLNFDLQDDFTEVVSTMTIIRQEKTPLSTNLELDGSPDLYLKELKINGLTVDATKYGTAKGKLTIFAPPQKCELEITTIIKPHENKSFSGLYRTKTIYCTQMEAQGFRKMTYFMDRPDILSKYQTTITANKTKYPILLSNGDCTSRKDLEDGRHQVHWIDPFPKPCYLFALVAGDLGIVKDTYKTKSGKDVSLEIYTDKGNESRCQHAMTSLIQSMKWEEDTYELEYDLNTYMVVAVEDFNMGAMENKGLNIFNSKYVLADKNTATDDEFSGIQSVIGHEYFHNWSGNRITCRDWFQLSLKEGLTVFRDQEFSSDLNSRPVKRIEDVITLRTRQFPEDAGGMAHPVRPPSYIAIDNFYTATVYLKGAEVIRMMQTILGRDTFIKGVQKYFELYDGQAVTCDDFVNALELVSKKDLSQFKLWYSQVGTPTVDVKKVYNAESKELTLTFKQLCKHPVTNKINKPYHIPVRLGLMRHDGTPQKVTTSGLTETVIHLTEEEQSFTFPNISEQAIPSLFRDYSAPVKVNVDLTDKDLLTLMEKEQDPFNQWESAQNLYKNNLLKNYQNFKNGNTPEMSDGILNAMRQQLKGINTSDKAFTSKLIELPSLNYMLQFIDSFQPPHLEEAYSFFKLQVQNHLKNDLSEGLSRLRSFKTNSESEAADVRALKSTILNYLTWENEVSGSALLKDYYDTADNMTDSLAALILVNHKDNDISKAITEDFYQKWNNDSLVINKWFSAQAVSLRENTLDKVIELSHHQSFDKENPNKLYALQMTFASSNAFRFHNPNGKGYAMMMNTILDTDQRNPQVASRLTTVFSEWTQWAPELQKLAKKQLEEIQNSDNVSKNVYEIASSYLRMGNP